MNKAVLVAAALVLAPLTTSGQEAREGMDRDATYARKAAERSDVPSKADDPSHATIKDRVAEAIETIEDACAADLDDFCGKVTSGKGRVALCMVAHEDRLSGRCRSALYRIGRQLQRNVDRVAEGCWNEIQALCGDAGKVGRCLEQKKSSLSSSCQTIVAGVGQKLRTLSPRVGMPVYSSDDKNLGQIVDVVKGPDERIQSIQVDIGRLLGLGTKVVSISADKLEQLPRVKVLLSDSEVRSLPEAKKE
jgi:hypothetical protein